MPSNNSGKSRPRMISKGLYLGDLDYRNEVKDFSEIQLFIDSSWKVLETDGSRCFVQMEVEESIQLEVATGGTLLYLDNIELLDSLCLAGEIYCGRGVSARIQKKVGRGCYLLTIAILP